MQRDRLHISPAPGAGVPPGEGLLLSLSLAVLFAAADVCGDMTRQVAGRVSYACAAGKAASSLQALVPVPFGSVPPQRRWVCGKSGTSSRAEGPGVPAGLGGTGKGKAVLLIQHGSG